MEFCSSKINESSQKFLNDLVQTILNNTKKHPLIAAIAGDQEKFSEFLNLVPQVLQAMSPEEREQVATGPEGLKLLLNPMFEYMIRMYPELNQLQREIPVQHGSIQMGSQRLISLANQLASQRGESPHLYVNMLRRVIAKNPNRVAIWASEIKTPEELMAKFDDWKQRGIV